MSIFEYDKEEEERKLREDSKGTSNAGRGNRGMAQRINVKLCQSCFHIHRNKE